MNEETKPTPIPSTEPQKDPNAVMQNVVRSILPDELKNDPSQTTSPSGKDVGTFSQIEKLDPRFVQKAIRTYESDLAEAMGKKGTSSASIAISENTKKDKLARMHEAVIQSQKPINVPQRSEIIQKVEVQPTQAPSQDENIIIRVQVPKQPPQAWATPTIVVPKMETPKAEPIPYIIVKKPVIEVPKVAPSIVVPKAAPQIIIPKAMPQEIPKDIPREIPKEIPKRPPVEMRPPIPEEPEEKRDYGRLVKQGLLVIIAIAFIGGGVWGGYYLYKQSLFANPPAPQKGITVSSIIPFDKQVMLTVGETATGEQLISQLHTQINKQSGSSGQITDFILMGQNDADYTTPTPTRLTASSFIDLSKIAVPGIIQRSITDRWMLGSFTEDGGQKTTFVALSTDFFQNVFAGMLAWEDTMPHDLASLFDYRSDIQGVFTDKVIRNRDVREFRNPNNELVLLYSFIDRDTLIVTTTESALVGAIDHIEKQSYVR